MKALWLGVGIYVLGFFVVALSANIWSNPASPPEFGYYYAIVFSALYLAAVVGISTSLIIKKLDQRD